MPWNDSSILWTIVVGLVGIIVTVFLYFRPKDKKILEYIINPTQLITEKMTSIPNLKITIDDQPLKTLTSTKIQFLNAGNQSIVLSDFAIKEPLGLTIDGRLHSYDISADNPNSTPDLQPFSNDDKPPQVFHIKFDFLKPKQSFSITLLHDGPVTVFGELKNGVRREYHDPLTSRARWYVVISTAVVLGLIICFIFSVVNSDTDFFLHDFLPVTAIPLLLFIPLFSELVLFLERKLRKNK